MKVENGESINIWLDPWVLASNNARVTTCITPGLQEATVSSLFKPGTKEWDQQLLNDIFNEEDARHIVQIPLSMDREQDSWLWIEDEKGKYTVKSGYRLICKMQNQVITNRTGGFDWLKLCSLLIPPKIKILHVKGGP